jgi:arylsulfatase A-like enzyme
VVVALLAACRGEPPHEPTREQVVLRLDAKDFGDAAAHPAMVDIGDLALPVAYARDVRLSPIVRTSPARAGRVRAAVSVPRDVVGWPRSVFALRVMAGAHAVPAPPVGIPDAVFGVDAMRLQHGWRLRLRPRAPERGKLVADLPSAHDGEIALVQVQAVAPMARHMTSRRFDVASGSTLTLRYGLADRTGAAPAARVCFRARLDCAWSWKRELVSDCVVAGPVAERRWHEVDVPLRWGGRSCTLDLDADGADVADPAWAVPLVRAPATDDPVAHPNVVLISLDTLRADHLSGYGYPRPTSPSLDELVLRRGATFTNAMATYPMTHFSHLSIFTGLFTAALPANGILPASAPVVTLTELLRDAGFTTIGVTEDTLVSREYGFGRGFDHLVELHPGWADRARLVFARGRELLRTMRRRRFFLFLHNYKVHRPYLPSPGYATLFPSDAGEAALPDVPAKYRDDRDAYDRSIRELDDEVGGFLRALEVEGLADRTLLIVLSDHGEAFGEHGFAEHGFSPHQEALHVVLAFRGPGIAVHRITTPVSLADVAPTLLDVLGLPVPPGMQGRSLRKPLSGQSIGYAPEFFEWNGDGTRGMRFGNSKLVRQVGRTLFYDLARDPTEADPVDLKAKPAPPLERLLDDYEAEGTRRRAVLGVPGDAPSISPELQKSLRGLGYVE